MPLQRIETIDEPRSRTEAQGDLFDAGKAHPDDFRNRLIWGDNKLVMASLLAEFRGAVDLIYIDPPFDVGADFTMDVPVGEAKNILPKEQSLLEMVAYRDMWGRGTDSYLSMLYERLTLMKQLLRNTGTIYVHCDSTMGHFIKLLLDATFGQENFRREIIWNLKTASGYKSKVNGYVRGHDTILYYVKENSFVFNKQFQPHKPEYVARFKKSDQDGRLYRDDRPGGRRQYLDETDGVALTDVWSDIMSFQQHSTSKELLGYPTQKPLPLCERIIKASSNEGDLVADFFCGSGTTLAAAEKLNRRWIGSDLGRFAIHTTRKRMIDIQRDRHGAGEPYRSFDIYNLGRYERQWWQREDLKGADEEHRGVVLKFFRAEVVSNAPSPLIHGRRGAAFVHVDGIDSILTRGEVSDVAKAVSAAGGKQVHCLAWDFEMDLRQAVTAIETGLDIKISLHRIPREIMERNRTEMPPFFEIAFLEAEPVIRSGRGGGGKGGKTADIRLTNFIPSLTEVPAKELEALEERAMESGFDFIDFWAVDFDWDPGQPGQPFNHHWQDYRTRRDRSLKTLSDAAFRYDKAGRHTACVKVVDVFGCDTSITVEIEA